MNINGMAWSDPAGEVEAEFNKMIEAITGNTDGEQKHEKRINSIAH